MKPEVWAEIKRMRVIENQSLSEIARKVGMDRKTVRRALEAGRLPAYNLSGPKPSILDPFKGYIRERVGAHPNLSGVVLLEEIKRQGYPGKVKILTEHLAAIRSKAKEVFLRLETPPGYQAQCDWANCGTVVIGHAKRKLSCFVMILSWSRLLYVEFTLSQCLEDFLQCHINAFKFFGGIPKKILYDNLKLVVLSRLGSQIVFNPKFMEFSGIFGFEPVPCNVARGNEKGKAESSIYYLRRNFLEGRTIAWPKIQEESRQWLGLTANVRLHRTTQERPIDRWEKEKPLLWPLPQSSYDASIVYPTRSTHQALVRFEANAYSVPHQHAYKTALVRADKETVRILLDGLEIARHPRCYDRGSVIEDPKHFEGVLAAKKKALASRLLKSFLELDKAAGDYLEGLADTHVQIGRHIAQIMELTASYGKAEVGAAVIIALEYKAFGSAYVQNILLQRRYAKGLKEVLPITIPQKPSWNEIVTEEPDLGIYDKLTDGPANET